MTTGGDVVLSDEMKAKLIEARANIQQTYGQIVLAMSSVPRYRNLMLSDLSHLVVEPLINDRIAIAKAKSAGVIEPPAIAIWASVSDEVDARISEQAKAGVFPVRLKSGEWRSGDIVWLLDVIAPTRELATTVLASFNQVAKQDNIKIYPTVTKLVDRDVLQKLATASSEAATPLN